MRRILLTCLLLAGCRSNTTGPDGAVRITTDRTTYMPVDTVAITVRNDTDETVFVPHCAQRIILQVERAVPTGWVQHQQVNAPCPAMHPSGERPLAAGAVEAEAAIIAQEGVYRVRLLGRRGSEDFGGVAGTSRTFRVRWPPD